MPIYEFRCGGCNQISSFFTRSINSPLEPVCEHCQGTDMQRRMSAFTTGKTTGSVQARNSANPNSAEYYSDPRNIGRNLEEGFKRFGMDMPASVKDTIDAAREGELPKGMDT